MIEILDIKMKKGQELLEERAQKIFSKPFIELTEKERNHLNVVKVKARCSAVLNHIKITGIELTDLGGRDVLFMPLTGKNEQCVQIINKEDLECLKRKINELYENNSTLCTVENSNTEIRITDIIINMLFGASEVKAECALIINDSIKFEKIKIVQNEKGLNIIKPYRKNQEGKIEYIYQFDEAINAKIDEIILEQYKKDLEKLYNEEKTEEIIYATICKKNEKEEYLVIKDLDFDIENTELSLEKGQENDEYILFLEVRALHKKYSRAWWAPYLYINNGIPIKIKNLDDLAGKSFEYDYKKDSSQTWIMYVFEHEDISKGKIEFLSKEGNTFTVKWSGLANIYFDKVYDADVPFECVFKVDFCQNNV